MNTLPIIPLCPKAQLGSIAAPERQITKTLDYIFLSGYFTLMLQGLFFDQVTLWVTERRYIVFNLLPFNLYPSDFFLTIGLFVLLRSLFTNSKQRERADISNQQQTQYRLPVYIFALWGSGLLILRIIAPNHGEYQFSLVDLAAIFLLIPLFSVVTILRRLQPFPIASRQLLLLLWWTMCFFGILNGFIGQTTNLLGDIRELLLRSLFAVTAYHLGLRVNLFWVNGKLINLGLLFSLVFGLLSITRLSGISLSPLSLGSTNVHATLPLLLPYSLALARALQPQGASTRFWLYPLFLAISILLTLSKPTVIGLLICTAVTIFIVGFDVMSSLRSIIVFLAVSSTLVVIGLSILNSTSGAEQIVRSAYLKQDYAVQDLSGSRLAIWDMAFQTWLQNPVVGNGYGFLLSGNYIDIHTGSYRYQAILWPHNIVIQILLQTGLLGFAVFIIIVGGWFTQVRDDAFNFSGQERWAYASYIAVPITILLMAQYGQFWTHVHGGFLLWSCLGLEAALVKRTRLQNAATRVHE